MKTKSEKNNKGLQSGPEQVVQSKTQHQPAAEPETLPAIDNQKAEPPSWRGVFFRGPEPTQDRQTGDGIPSWAVFVGNEDADPRGKVYTVYSFSRAQELAQAMAKDRCLELISKAQPAGPVAAPPVAA